MKGWPLLIVLILCSVIPILFCVPSYKNPNLKHRHNITNKKYHNDPIKHHIQYKFDPIYRMKYDINPENRIRGKFFEYPED